MRSDSGQVAVEAALAMPLMVMLVLGILQLASLQQARVLTEYAAFCAARAGIVWSGSNERMHDAALVALLPTLGRTDGLKPLGETWQAAQRLDAELQRALVGGLEEKLPPVFEAANLLGMVRVDTLSPAGHPELGRIWNVRGGEAWQELDLDGPDSYPESPQLEGHLARFYDLTRPDASQAAYRRATVLTLRVRYLYELRVPVVNGILFASWFATTAGRGIRPEQGLATVTPKELEALWELANGRGGARRFFIPLTATYSMRMQSNFHRKWLMHLEPGWSL